MLKVKLIFHKMAITLKEANKTEYWLDLLHQSNYLDEETSELLNSDMKEIVREC